MDNRQNFGFNSGNMASNKSHKDFWKGFLIAFIISAIVFLSYHFTRKPDDYIVFKKNGSEIKLNKDTLGILLTSLSKSVVVDTTRYVIIDKRNFEGMNEDLKRSIIK